MNNTREMSRRDFGKLFFFASARASLGAPTVGTHLITKAAEWAESFASNREEAPPENMAHTLSKKLRSWELSKGIRMSSIVPELALASAVLEAPSLAQYIPPLTGAVTVDTNLQGEQPGNFLYTPHSDIEHSIRIKAKGRGIDEYTIPYIDRGVGKIGINANLNNQQGQLAVVAKEAMQIADFIAYAKTYKSLLEENGATFTVVNPENLPLSDEYIAVNIAMAQTQIEMDRGMSPWFQQFVDLGAHLRIGGILYANWLLNYPEEEKKASPDFVIPGENAAGFLQKEGLIRQQGNTFVWTRGRAPEINREFINLYSRFIGV